MADELLALQARVDSLSAFLQKPRPSTNERAYSDSGSGSDDEIRSEMQRGESSRVILRSRSRDSCRSRSRRRKHKKRSMPEGFAAANFYRGYFMPPFASPPCASYFNPFTWPAMPANVTHSRSRANAYERIPAAPSEKKELQDMAQTILQRDTLPTPSSSSAGPSTSRSRRKNRWDDNSKEVAVAKYHVALPAVMPDRREDGSLPIPLRVDVQGNGLGENRRFRALYTHGCTRSADVDWDRSTVVGPWNKIREDALTEAERLKDAYSRGGFTEMGFEAVALHREALGAAVPDDVNSWELQERTLQSGQLQFRCSCRVDRLTKDSTSFQSAWKASSVRAEEDLWSLFDSFRTGGLANVQRIVANQTSAMRLPGLL